MSEDDDIGRSSGRTDKGLFVVTVKRKSRTRVVSSAGSATGERSDPDSAREGASLSDGAHRSPLPEEATVGRVVVPLGYHQRPTLRLKGDPFVRPDSEGSVNGKRGRIVPRRRSGMIQEPGSLPPIEPVAPFGPTEEPKDFFERVFRHRFYDMEVLERALTHRSMHAALGDIGDYERLEFLGDAVLDLAMAHLLLEAHPGASEGELSKMRAALVNTTTLAEIAREINIGPLIKLSRGELASGGAERVSILADVMEAVIGAVYREAGFETALHSIRNLFGFRIVEVSPSDPKTELQELMHAQGRETPKYLLELMEGPEHSPLFVSVVEVGGEIVGRGRGSTKKISQQQAAAEALQKMRGTAE